MQPLQNIRILDITRALAGPYCTMMLGDLGADVIKIERPGVGDETRGWGPPFVGAAYNNYPGESAYFLAANRNKRSVTVNIQSKEGQEIIRKLAGVSDVLVENYRTGDLDKLGLGYNDLHKQFPKLIYCSVSGYGRTGPYADRPGYDAIIQGEGGMMSITGPADGPPSRAGIPIIDITSGMFAATAILAALRARDLSGEGQLVDISLFDAHVALLTNVASNYLIGDKPPRRYGNAHPNLVPYDSFSARDGWFIVGVANDKQWAQLCDVLTRPEWKTDARYANNKDRVSNREGLVAELNRIFSERDVDDWLADLTKTGLPCGRINSIPDVFAHPQAHARDMILETNHASAGTVKLPGFPYKFSHTPAEIQKPPPMLGQHTEEVLTGVLGYSREGVEELKGKGAI
ncbi:MAG TPA: CaiB/BaiF CoA-transferase family protein [Anaerolineales bacterium]|mgnify:CR=1 FL=1|jgi:formyl-CoA transferase|nr:CaiB/BaiF CoA-transferase family protein [Anaerolineales bacterium]HQX15650.1 CaiB/BaiF CoA-transferase family protein [Anaerolineales bacterium]